VRRSERGNRSIVRSISHERLGSKSVLGRDGLEARRACNLHSFDGVSKRRNTLTSGTAFSEGEAKGSRMSRR
jgi:hypothetical protein